MVIQSCQHDCIKKSGFDRHGVQRYKCCLCGKRWADPQPKPLGDMRIDLETAKQALRLLVEGMSIRATETNHPPASRYTLQTDRYLWRCLPAIHG